MLIRTWIYHLFDRKRWNTDVIYRTLYKTEFAEFSILFFNKKLGIVRTMIRKPRRRKSNTLVPRIWKISYLWSRVFELSCRFPRRWGEGKNPDSSRSSTSRGMIYGKVYGRWIVLARFLIEISSHARHNNFSRTCKHEGRPRVRSIFSTWTWTIILFDRSASISR